MPTLTPDAPTQKDTHVTTLIAALADPYKAGTVATTLCDALHDKITDLTDCRVSAYTNREGLVVDASLTFAHGAPDADFDQTVHDVIAEAYPDTTDYTVNVTVAAARPAEPQTVTNDDPNKADQPDPADQQPGESEESKETAPTEQPVDEPAPITGAGTTDTESGTTTSGTELDTSTGTAPDTETTPTTDDAQPTPSAE